MHEKILTRAEPPQAFLERLDPRLKIACTLVWAVCVVTVPAGHAGLLAAYALLLLLLLILSYRNLGRFARRFAAALPFIVLLTALLPFFKEGQVLWQLGPITITQEGLWSAQRVAASALLCVAAVCLVWATTPEPDLIDGLKGVGVPAMFVGVLAFMLRYLHVLRPELHRLWDARAARTVGHRNGARFRSAANLLGAFFVRSHERAVRVADAMAARGYDGQWRVARRRRWRAFDALLGGVFLAGVVLLRWMPWS
jgi:cobalt/nickel transport system permease protein